MSGWVSWPGLWSADRAAVQLLAAGLQLGAFRTSLAAALAVLVVQS